MIVLFLLLHSQKCGILMVCSQNCQDANFLFACLWMQLLIYIVVQKRVVGSQLWVVVAV